MKSLHPDRPLKYILANIVYRCNKYAKSKYIQKSISPIGIDTEALTSGKCFLICTSRGDIWTPEDWPKCVLSKKHRNEHYVAYNLRYDEGHLVQFLPRDNLSELRETNKTSYEKYTVRCIPKKMLRITRNNNGVTIWDLFSFFRTSLNSVSKELLNKEKIDIDTNLFTSDYITSNHDLIVKYCINDALLCAELAEYLIKTFENYGIFPRKLYSTAYIASRYFDTHCNVPRVRRFYNYYPEMLQYALNSYRGGKFEVTEKGVDKYYEYDINSAYPYEISNLIDVTYAKVHHSKNYIKDAVYAFLLVKIDLQEDFKHPISLRFNGLCTYPIGTYHAYITLNEYNYMIENNQNIKIIDGYWLTVKEKVYPYRDTINNLFSIKDQLKKEGKKLDYYVIKIFLNSWYGKMIQLIKDGEKYRAGAYWHPIFASVITANTRLRVCEMQNRFDTVCAVFTDSCISTKKLPLKCSKKLGDWDTSGFGKGVIFGSGIYQIGKKIKFRGFDERWPLWYLCDYDSKQVPITVKKPNSWREVLFHNWHLELINRFDDREKHLEVNFDQKRTWLDDWELFTDVLKRKVNSVPRYYDEKLGLL